MDVLSAQGPVAGVLRKTLTLGLADATYAPTMAIDASNYPPAIAFFLQRLSSLKPGQKPSRLTQDGSLALVVLGRLFQELMKWERGSAWIRGASIADEEAAKAQKHDPILERLLNEPGHAGSTSPAGSAQMGATFGIADKMAAWVQRILTADYTFAFPDTNRLLGEAMVFLFLPFQGIANWRGPKEARAYFTLDEGQVNELREWMASKIEAGATVMGEPMTLTKYREISSGSRIGRRAKVYVEMLKEKGRLSDDESQRVYRGIHKKERMGWIGWALGVLAVAVQRGGYTDPIASALNADWREVFHPGASALAAMKGSAAV